MNIKHRVWLIALLFGTDFRLTLHDAYPAIPALYRLYGPIQRRLCILSWRASYACPPYLPCAAGLVIQITKMMPLYATESGGSAGQFGAVSVSPVVRLPY